MTAPLLYIGCWDPFRRAGRLVADVRAALALLGRPADVEELGRGLVAVVVPVGDLAVAQDGDWAPLAAALGEFVLAVRPALASVTVEVRPDALGGADWPALCLLLPTGWVDLAQCSPGQVEAFQRLVAHGVATPYGPGVWWSADPVLALEDTPERLPAEAMAAAVYAAWTGHEPAPPPLVPTPPESPRELWFWSGGAEDALLRRVAAATPGLAVSLDPAGEPGWRPVIARADADRPVADLLDVLRSTVGVVAPSWAGVQPRGGLTVPGADPDLPVTGVVIHPWVATGWIGADLSRLDDTLAGCHREQVGGGVLWVTDPDAAPDTPFEAGWSDPGTRWERLVRAAAVLADVARQVPC